MNEDLKFFSPSNANPSFYISLAGITYPDPGYRIVRKKSALSVIEYITDGEGYVCYEGTRHHLKKDMIYFLSKDKDHDYWADNKKPFTKIFMNVSGNFCEYLMSMYGLSGKHFFDGEGLKRKFERIPQIMHSEMPENEIQAAFQGLFVEIISRLSYMQKHTAYSDEALKLKEYLDANSSRIVSANELSKVIFRSPDYCLKLFRREFDTTPYAYQIDNKMQTAKALLANTNMSVGEIGASLGYSDLHYFSNIFKTKCGMRPLEYRKNSAC